jgi:hypothetical protein
VFFHTFKNVRWIDVAYRIEELCVKYIYILKYTRISTVRPKGESLKLYHEEEYCTTLVSSVTFPHVDCHLGSYVKLLIITYADMYLIFLLKISYSLIIFYILILISGSFLMTFLRTTNSYVSVERKSELFFHRCLIQNSFM